MRLKFFFFTLFIVYSILSSAQSTEDTLVCSGGLCCGNSLVPSGVMISHVHNRNEWMLSYRFMNMAMVGARSGTREVSNNDIFSKYLMAPDRMRMDMHMFMAMYGISGRLTAMAMFNYNVTTMDMAMFSSDSHHHGGMGDTENPASHTMKSSGIGDTKLYLLYGLIKKETQQLVLSFGASLPTGSTNVKGNSTEMMYAGLRYPYSMQMGSGTVDLLPGITYTCEQNRTTFSAQIASILRTGYNNAGYALGNEVRVNGWFAYQWATFLSSSVRVEGSSSDKISGYDSSLYSFTEPSSNRDNYGGKRVNIYLGSILQFEKGILRNHRLGFEYGIPAYESLNGIQMASTHSLNASWSLTF